MCDVSSVEGSVVNISASIPLLKPLVDLCFGVGALDSSNRTSSKLHGFRSRGHGSAMELNDVSGTNFNGRSFDTNKSKKQSVTMTRMIANAAGDNESEETILDDSPSEASGPTGHAKVVCDSKGSIHDTSRPPSHQAAPVNQQHHNNRSRAGAEGDQVFHGGIYRTTDITIQYSTEEGRVASTCDKQQKKDWV